MDDVIMSNDTTSVLTMLDGPLRTATVGELTKLGISIEGLRDDMDPKEREKLVRMHRRKIANRESAKRSKIRKKSEDAKLLSAAETLLQDAATMRKTITTLQKKVDTLYAENVKLRQRLGDQVGEHEEKPPSVIEPVELPPEVETPSLVMKEARKKKRGMLKSQSDSSIATTFEEADDPEPAMKRVAVHETTNIRKHARDGAHANSGAKPPRHANGDRLLDDIQFGMDGFYGDFGNDIRSASPFLTNNYAMYTFNDGEILGSDLGAWDV